MFLFPPLNLPLLCYILGLFDHFSRDLLHIHLPELLLIIIIITLPNHLIRAVRDSVESPALGLLIKLAILTATA